MAYSADPTLYLYTSLTAGSSHIITATSRLETILKANKIPFRALDVATDEKARMLWGRRSKGRKLPGLVKYGNVIGDMEEIEEWNEYGELKMQLSAADAGAGFAAPSTSTSASTDFPAGGFAGAMSTVTASKAESGTPAAPEEPQTQSRSASEARHISISEPTDSHDTPDPAPAPAKKDATPLAIAMRQAGVEAAAKAGQMKSKKATTLASSQREKDKEPDIVPDTTAPVLDQELTVDKALADPETATQITAAKTPAQLASEGARKTSVDKIAESEGSSGAASPTGAEAAEDSSSPTLTPSKEEQVLNLRRQSSIAKTKSGLSSEIDVDDVDEAAAGQKQPVDDLQEEDEDEDGEDETAVDTSSHAVAPEPVRLGRTHRGSSISEASKEEIAEVERRNTIHEEEEEDDEEDAGKGKVSEVAEKVGEKTYEKKTQEQDPKSAEGAGVSVGD